MKPGNSIINNQDGSILLIAVVILIAVTLLGIFAINTSTIEIQIAGNDKVHKQAFCNAEGGLRAIYTPIEDLRKGVDPTGFQAAYGGLNFIGNPDDFWDEGIDDDNSTNENGPDVIVAICNNAEVDIDKLSSDMTGETIINRAGYEGLGKGASANWVAGYRVASTGTAGSGAESQTSAILGAIR